MSLKQYIYDTADRTLPPGELRLEFPVVKDANDADIFVWPGSLSQFKSREDLYGLPQMRGREHRHVFLGLGEDTTTYDMPCMFLRPNLTQDMLEHDENSISIPWPVEDFGSCARPQNNAFDYDVSFHGWLSRRRRGRTGTTREIAVNSCRDEGLKTDFHVYPTFYGHQSLDEQLKRRRLYLDSLQQSKLALCPESIPGNIPYRFYEAMSAGRVPVLVGSNYVLPFADVIDWTCVYEVALDRAPYTGGLVSAYLAVFRGQNLIDEGRRCRSVWARYLCPAVWPYAFALAIERKLAKVAA